MESRKVVPIEVTSTRLVKSEDLNHHGTLFAGRSAEWFVESGFVAAASLFNPKKIVCLKIHGMYFTKPVRAGEIIKFSSRIVYTGNSSIVAYIKVSKSDGVSFVQGFITFIHVSENTQAEPHYIEITPETEEDRSLYERAKNLHKK